MTVKKAVAAALSVVMLLFVSCGESIGEMTVEFMPTGDSDCIIIRDGEHTVLIDTADSDDYKEIFAHLTDLGVTRIDAIILTHYDNDHVGSASKIVRDFEVGAVYGPNYVRTSSNTKELDREAEKKSTPVTKLNSDTVLTFGNMVFGIGVPTMENYDDENDYSLIISLSHGSVKLLFLGDACKERMNEYNMTSIGTEFDVVKFPHHGDYFKALKSFVQFNRFSYAVSCVADASDIDERLCELIMLAGAKSLVTSDGMITFVSDGSAVTLSE